MSSFMTAIDQARRNMAESDVEMLWHLYLTVHKHADLSLLGREGLLRVAFTFAQGPLGLDRHFKLSPIAERDPFFPYGTNVEENDMAASRLLQIIEDARDAKIPVDPLITDWLIKLSDHQLDNYEALFTLISFLSKSQVSLDSRHLRGIIGRVSFLGNYTACAAILHIASVQWPLLQGDIFVIKTFLEALLRIRPDSSENLPGYPAGSTNAAELKVPRYLGRKSRFHYGMIAHDTQIDPIESMEDSYQGFRAALDAVPYDLSLADLSKPDMEPGSISVVRKAIQLLAIYTRVKSEDTREYAGTELLNTAIRVFLEAKHPRMAIAAYNVLTAEPFFTVPDNETYFFLVRDAGHRREIDVISGLLRDMRQRGLEPAEQLTAELIGISARFGNPEESEKIRTTMEARGLVPDHFTEMAYIDTIFARDEMVDPLEVMESLKEKKMLNTFVANKILTLLSERILDGKASMADLEQAFRYPHFQPDSISIDIMLKMLAATPRPDLDRIKELVLALEAIQLTDGSVWGSVFKAFTRHPLKRGVNEVLMAMYKATARRRPIKAEDLPREFQDFPLLGVEPPIPSQGASVIMILQAEKFPTQKEREQARGYLKELVGWLGSGPGSENMLDAFGLLEKLPWTQRARDPRDARRTR